VTVEAVTWLLLEEFANALDRPIERGTPTQAETQRARQVAERMVSAEYLALHCDGAGDDGQPEAASGRVSPMQSLKISAGVFIRWEEVEWGGRHISAAFQVREGIIEVARLKSEPTHNWVQVEARLGGVAFKEWEQCLHNG
jgi:hypothetical protein